MSAARFRSGWGLWICVTAIHTAGADTTAVRTGGGVYVGASGGYSELDIRQDHIAQVDADSFDDTSLGWKVFFGGLVPYQNGAFAGTTGLELSYVDLGEAEARITPAAGNAQSNFTADFQAVGISGVIGIDIGSRVSILGKLGWFFGMTDSDPSDNPGIAFSDTWDADDDDGFHVGLGLTYSINEHLDLRVDWDRYEIFTIQILGPATEDSNPDFFSAGLQYRF